MGIVLRLLVVVAWLGLYGWHVARTALPGLGLVERRDVAAILDAHLERAFTYAVRAADGKTIGRCEVTLQRDDTLFRIDTTAELDDLPGAGPLLTGLGLGGERPAGQPHLLTMYAAIRYDDRYRLVGAEGRLRLLSVDATAQGKIEPRGLAGRVEINGLGPPSIHDFVVPDAERVQGLAFAPCLPPRLVPGDRFSAWQLRLDPLAMRPAVQLVVYTVDGTDTIEVGRQAVTAMKVVMTVDHKPHAILWCDRNGTVYRMAGSDGGMRLDLTAVRVVNGEPLWPPKKSGRVLVPDGGRR